jgi:hypothetical protein
MLSLVSRLRQLRRLVGEVSEAHFIKENLWDTAYKLLTKVCVKSGLARLHTGVKGHLARNMTPHISQQ